MEIAAAQKITTFLMFEGSAEEAMTFYTSLFDDAEIVNITRYGADGPGTEGSVQHATFSLAGEQFMCVDSPAKHDFTFTPAISLFVQCRTESDRLYAALAEHGTELNAAGRLRLQRQIRLGQRPLRRLLAAESPRLTPPREHRDSAPDRASTPARGRLARADRGT